MSLQAAFYSVGIPTLTPTPKRSLHPIRAQVEPSEKSVEIMRKFSEQYARRSGTYFCVDKGVTSVVIKKSNLFCNSNRDWLTTKMHWEPHCALAGIMMTSLLRHGKDFGTVHVFP
ncbi:ferredoxin-thioredoxin reductase catalytic chain, chloroplastic isoform X2 [Magnolia sinica]|uniref:ferredoxin-thioredoxin reductase catalytic chain, chloroplastic isoform X2 n=1 Tax=Magnolia sinica TaxID=86752 RepID=UPI002659E20A|nr:ferredoxin-thioredoxin reductase catalytic chain, chloroplastic isoform X2 [Magnolia sinica]